LGLDCRKNKGKGGKSGGEIVAGKIDIWITRCRGENERNVSLPGRTTGSPEEGCSETKKKKKQQELGFLVGEKRRGWGKESKRGKSS